MRPVRFLPATLALVCLAACGPRAGTTAAPTAAAPSAAFPPAASSPAPATPAAAANPFFAPSPLPYQLPPFDRIKDADFVPAFDAGMAEQRKEIDAIAHAPAPATFDNTVVAMERSGRMLARVRKTFLNLNMSNTNDAMQQIEADMAPRLAAHEDAILLDPALFARVDAVYAQRDKLGLDAEAAQLLERYERRFLRAGAKLSEADKAELKQLNEQLSSLTTQFRQNVLKATKEGAVVVDDVKELDGLSPEQLSAAVEAAKARGLDGKWVLTLQNTTIQPPLEQLKSRALRQRIFEASSARATAGGADNRAVVVKILELRARKATLLGYPSFAAYWLAEQTAGAPAAVNDILGKLAPAALAAAKEEARDIEQRMRAQGARFKLEPWDWAFYARQVSEARYGFEDAQVKPYFEMNRVLEDGVLYAAEQAYGLSFKERKDLPRYHPDVRIFEVVDADGSTAGLLLIDYYKRDSKAGGAWMDNYVDQSTLLGQKPVVVNNLNVPKPAPGEPALLSFDEVTTMFHELGHGLHGLLSAVRYPLLSGINVPPDFGELPSQVNETWTRDPGVLAHFARHYRTGAPMPKELLDKVLAAQRYGQGYATLEYLQAAMLDQAWHQAAKLPAAAEVPAWEQATLAKAGVAFGPVPPRYHTCYFNHIFSSDEYSVGYYSYIWSEVLARDAGAWFYAHGGLTRANGDVFRAKILSRGRTREPSVLFQDFYGQPPDIGPLLEWRGLKLPGAKGGKK